MKTFCHLALAAVLATLSGGCALYRPSHPACACEYGAQCDCWRHGGCECQSTLSTAPQDAATTDGERALPPETPPPPVPAAEGASAAEQTPTLVSKTQDRTESSDKRSDDQAAQSESPDERLDDVALTRKTRGLDEQSRRTGVKQETSDSPPSAARQRLAQLIERENAAHSDSDDVNDAATSEAQRLLPVEEVHPLPPSANSAAGSQSMSPTPPVPSPADDVSGTIEDVPPMESATWGEGTVSTPRPVEPKTTRKPRSLPADADEFARQEPEPSRIPPHAQSAVPPSPPKAEAPGRVFLRGQSSHR